MKKMFMTLVRKFFSHQGWAYFLFWAWNLIFLAFMFLGFAPLVLLTLLEAVQAGELPPNFLVYAALLTAIPAITILLGFFRLRREPSHLFALGYGVEGPLMLLIALRLFAVRALTAAVAFLFIIAGLGIMTYLWNLLDRQIDRRGLLLTYLRSIGLTLNFLIGLYASLWIAFYAFPLGMMGINFFMNEFLVNLGQILDNLWSALLAFDWAEVFTISGRDLLLLPFFILWPILIMFSATLFVFMPIAIAILYTRSWWDGLSNLIRRYGWSQALPLTSFVMAVCIIFFIDTNRQPQHHAFALLENPPNSPAEAQALLEQQKAIREGLLNSYLAPLRYFSAVGEVYHVREMYERSLGLRPQQAAEIQRLYDTLARPVLYEPIEPVAYVNSLDRNRWDNRAFNEDSLQAAERYETFFDQDILDGEREAIVQAALSTWSIDQARQARQAVDDREVYLRQQEINIKEHGDWAEVELYEAYQNKTTQGQEVVYYFSLPESAVITGVWLGNSPNREKQFVYRIAPRGAAQAAYRNEVRRQVDPALVEQIGPRQYRLRVFPIEPRNFSWDPEADHYTLQEGPSLHLWLTWQVLAHNQAWPMPQLAEHLNVYWDDDSIRLVNGQAMQIDEETWLPEAVPAISPVTPVTHRLQFPSDEIVIIQPLATEDQPEPPSAIRLALVLDRSRSMIDQAEAVKTALMRLSRLTEAAIDVYLTASQYRGEEPSLVSLSDIDPDQILYYGGQNAVELLSQFNALHTDQVYEAIFVLTDGTGYKLGEGDIDLPPSNIPIWMIHLGGDFPLGYDDPTLEVIQASGGGVVGDVETALTRLAISLNRDLASFTNLPLTLADDVAADIIDGYLWLTLPATQAEAVTELDPPTEAPLDVFAAFAARRLILAEMARQRGNLTDLAILDHLHALAIKYSLVTPYSAMIVLINERQQKMLDELEKRADRFDREYEEIGETEAENPFTVTGVPEPEEWLLLGLVMIMLGGYIYTRRQQKQSNAT